MAIPTTTDSSFSGTLRNLQMLRALAALLVFLHHLRPHYENSGGSAQWLIALAERGGIGVDLFFVLSGFVITHARLRVAPTGLQRRHFIKHRLARIYLGYWPFLLFAALLAALTHAPRLEHVSALHSIFLTSATPRDQLLPVAWTLSFELYFYAAFALVFCLGAARLQAAAVVAFVAVLLTNLCWDLPRHSLGGFLLSPLLLEFLAGMLLRFHIDRLSQRGWIVPTLVLVVMGCAGVMLRGKVDLDTRVWSSGGTAVLLVLLALQLERQGWLVAGRLWVSLGDASYTLYLSHLLLIKLFVISGTRNQLRELGGWQMELGFAAFVVFVLALSLGFYRRVERPLYRRAIGAGTAGQPQ